MNHIGRGDKHSMGDFVPGAPCYTLTKGHSHAVAQPIPFRDTADCLTAAYGTKWNGNASADNGSLFVAQPIAYSIREDAIAENFSATELEVATALKALQPGVQSHHAQTFIAQPIAYNIAPGKGALKDDIHVTTADATKTLDASGSNPAMHQGGAAILQPIPFDTTQITSKANYSKPQAGDPCHPLAAGAHPPAICLMDQGGSVMTIENDITGTLRRETHGHEPVVMAFPWQSALDPIGKPTDLCGTLIKNQTPAVMYPTVVAPTLTAANNPSRSPQASEVTQQVYSVYQASMAVRRLTPVECERLQGFSDNYTNIKDKCPDGPRYKALGNSMAVPVMAWIGKRIQDVESIKK